MLVLNSALVVGGLTLLRDHLRTDTFHYLPPAPRVVVDGARPLLNLIRYRGARNGGFLTLEVDLSIDPATLDRVRSELANRVGHAVDLVPVLFDSGAVRLSVLGVEQPLLVERVLASTTPSLFGAARALFSVEVGEEAAVLLETAIRSGDAPVLVVYDLTFTGLRPARGLRARVDVAMAYDYLRQRFAANTLFFKADLDAEAEALRRAGHIQIEDVDYLGVDPAILAERERDVQATLSELAETLFVRPAASPASLQPTVMQRFATTDTAWAQRGRPQAAFLLRDLEQRELQTFTYELNEAAAAPARIAPQASLRTPAGVDAATLVLDVTDDEPPVVVEVRAFVAPGADWTSVAAVQVDFMAGDDVRSVVLSSASADSTLVLPSANLTYSVRVLAEPEPDALGAPPVVDPLFRPLTSRNLSFDPQTLSGRRVVRVTTGVVDTSEVPHIEGRLVVDDRSREFLLDSTQLTAEIPIWGPSPARLELAYHLTDGSVVRVEKAVSEDASMLVINQPPGLVKVVVVTLQDPLERLEFASVELEAAAGQTRSLVSLTNAAPSAQWSMPRLPDADAGFRYRVRTIGRDARVEESDWQPGAGSLLVVGDLDVRLEHIQGVLLGGSDAIGALITLTSLDPPPQLEAAVETVLDAGQATFDVRLAFRRDAPRHYRVEGLVFLPTGDLTLESRTDTAEVLLLLVSQ